jgi:hypothetical protein
VLLKVRVEMYLSFIEIGMGGIINYIMYSDVVNYNQHSRIGYNLRISFSLTSCTPHAALVEPVDQLISIARGKSRIDNR